MRKQELWKNIPGYERYAVSNLGRVKNNISGKLLNMRKAKNGYMRVNLRKGNVKYEKPTVTHVHRLVAEMFLTPITGKNCVNHIDGDKENNCVDNLEWVTSKENTMHAIKVGLMNPDYSEMNKKSRIKSNAAHNTKQYRQKMQMVNQMTGQTKPVSQISIDTGEILQEYVNCNEAARFLFGEGTTKDRLISRCARGKCKSAYGFLWKYKEDE